LDGFDVQWIAENGLEIFEIDKGRSQTERILSQHGLVEGLAGGPKEKDDCNRDLRREQQVG